MKIAALIVPLLIVLGLANPQDAEPPSFWIYEVSDLLSRPPDFRAGEIFGVRKTGQETNSDSEGDDARSAVRRELAGGRLLELIKASLTPERWGPGDLKMHDRGLLVTTTKETHKELARLLGDLRRERALVVRVEAAVIPVGEEALDALPTALTRKLRRAAFEGVLSHAFTMTQDDVDTLLESVPEGLETEFVAPRVHAFNHQVNYTLVINQAAMVADVKVSKQNGQTEAEPVIGVLNTGIVVQVQPAVSEDRRHIALALDIQTAKLKRTRVVMANELERFKEIPEVGEWPIEIPELERRMLKTTVNLPAGVWVLVGSLQSDGAYEKDSLQIVLVKAAVVESGETEK